jgi:hypothetical protein
MEELRSRMFENRVLGRLFGFKREELAGDWRKLHSDEHHKFVLFTTYY